MTHKQHFILLAIFFAVFTPLFFFSSSQSDLASAQLIEENLYGWAWSNNVGWISFNSRNCDTDGNDRLDPVCGGTNTETLIPYGVKRKNNQFYGYAWSGNTGMTGTVYGGGLYFGPEGSSTNRTAGGSRMWAYYEPTSKSVRGWARFCTDLSSCASSADSPANDKNGGWDGWVSLSYLNTPGSQVYGVKFNSYDYEISGLGSSGYGCEKTKMYNIAPKAFYGCAWAGGDDDTNPANINNSPQFPGWIDFNYVLNSSTPIIPPGTGGGTCSNGVLDPGEVCVDGGGICPGTCGGGVGNCLNGDSNPNPNGVTTEDLISCPLYISDCQLTQGSTIMSPQANIDKGSYVWKVVASGGSTNATYKITWKENGSEISSCNNSPICSRPPYLTDGPIKMEVEVKTTDNLSSPGKIHDCHSDYIVTSNLAGTPLIIFYNSSVDNSYIKSYAKFTGTLAPVYDVLTNAYLKIRVADINGLCINDIFSMPATDFSIEKRVDGYWQTVPSLNYMSPSISKSFNTVNNITTFGINNLKLNKTTIWSPSSEYQIKVKVKTSNTSTLSVCNNKEKELKIPLQIQQSGGEYIEQ